MPPLFPRSARALIAERVFRLFFGTKAKIITIIANDDPQNFHNFHYACQAITKNANSKISAERTFLPEVLFGAIDQTVASKFSLLF